MDTVTVYAPSPVDITMDDGTVYNLRAGFNHEIPQAVASHWFAIAMNVQVSAEEISIENVEGELEDLQRRADAVSLKVDRRWSIDRMRREVETAEEAATKPAS